GGAEEREAVEHFVIEQIADGKMAAEHVLAEDAAVAAEAHAFGIEDDFGGAAEVADDVPAAGVDLFEEEAFVDVRPGDGREVFDRVADETLVHDRADHRAIVVSLLPLQREKAVGRAG